MQVALRIVAPGALCLERSIAVCAAVRSVGLPASVVVGRRNAYVGLPEYDFHAWVELNGEILNDDPASAYATVIQARWPSQESPTS